MAVAPTFHVRARAPRIALSILALFCVAACSGGDTTPFASSSAGRVTASAQSAAVASSNVAQYTEAPKAADSLANSVGVVVDLTTIAGANVTPTATLTRGLGVRHARIAILRADAPYDAIVDTFLTGSGVRADGVTNCAPPLGPYPAALITATDIKAFQSAIGNRLEAYEAVNEPDGTSDANWAADARSCMSAQVGALPGVPFIAPALVNSTNDASTLGNVSGMTTYGNIHRYFDGRNPGTAGWGGVYACGTAGALVWAMCEARVNTQTQPLMVTETGYNSQTEVDEATQAKYLSRLIFVNHSAGIARSYIYCMTSYVGGDAFAGNGLLRADLSPKPAYTAIKNELALFSDWGLSSLTWSPVTYAIAGGPSTLQHELFRKANGSWILALWNETQSWNPNGGGEIAVAAQTVAVTLPSLPKTVVGSALDDSGNLQPANVSVSGKVATLAVDDHMTFIIVH